MAYDVFGNWTGAPVRKVWGGEENGMVDDDSVQRNYMAELYKKYGLSDQIRDYSVETNTAVEYNGGLYSVLDAPGRTGTPGKDYYSSDNFYNDATPELAAFRKAAQDRVVQDPTTGAWLTPVQDYYQSQQLMKPFARQDSSFDKFFEGLASNLPLSMGLAMMGGGLTGQFGSGTSIFDSLGVANPFNFADKSWGINPAASGGTSGAGVAGATGGAELAAGAAGGGGLATGGAAGLGEFSLAGGTAGSAGGGLFSGAGGVTGLTAGGGLGLTAPATAGALGAGAGATAATAMGGATGGFGSFVDSLLSGLNPAKLTVSDVAKSGINYLINRNSAKDMEAAAREAAMMSDPLNQAKRFPYQDQLAYLLANPEKFYETNPVVKAQLDLAKNQFLANSAKLGTGGTQFSNYLKDVQNIAAGTFKDQANLLSTLSGFQFPGAQSSSNFMGGAKQAAGYNQEALGSIGMNKIIDKIFGNKTIGQAIESLG